MAQQNSSEELDIAQVMNRIREGYHSFLVWLYNIFRFFVSRWIILLALIIVGVILGLLRQTSEYPKETTLLVQINFDAANFVYDAIDQLDIKINEKDTVLLKEIGFYKQDTIIIKEVKIEPIVDIMEIVRSESGNERNIEILMLQSRGKEDILGSEIFIPKYKVHRINLLAGSNANEKTIETLLDFLNENPILNKVRETTVESTRLEILQNEQSIGSIDSIVKAYAKSPSEVTSTSQLYFNNMDLNNSNMHLLFEQKSLMIERNEKLKVELIKYDNIVQLMNKPMLQVKKEFWGNKIIVYPLLLLLFFVLFGIAKYFYSKARRLSMGSK